MSSKKYSLKKRILLWISIPVLISSILILLLAFLFSWHEIEEVYDAQMVHTAKTLLQLTEHEIEENEEVNISLGAENPNLKHHYENKTTFRVWKGDRLVLQSHRAKDFGDIQAPPGFSNQTVKEKPWRFFVFIDTEKNIKIETAERYAIRYELIGQLMLSLIIPMAILIPLLLFIVWLGIRQSIAPLTTLSAAVDTREIDDLDPIQSYKIPLEISPLVEALNRLFLRIGDSFKREREFTDHAAHELRTPLAAMKTQTQVLIKKASSMPDCQEGLENLNATIDRSAHLIEQLLSLARLQNESLQMEPVDLSECILDALGEITRAANLKNQTLHVDISRNVIISGQKNSLFMMIRNLLDNAVKYTPENGKIDISLNKEGLFTIADNGPGISDNDKKRVFNRFVRSDKTGQNGSGLGLSIVQWVADTHRANITLSDNAPQGLIVTVSFRR